MNHNVLVIVTSLVSILLVTFHHSDDLVRGMAPPGLSNLIPVAFLLVWLYATLILAERRSGYIINLVASLLAFGLALVHMVGSGLAGPRIGTSDGGFFFAWTVIALGATTGFSVILSVRG